MSELSLTTSKVINAKIERVFDAWLDPALLTQFILPAPGMPQPETTNTPKEGGNFEIIMDVGDAKMPHTGTYLEINRPDKLVFTWVSEFSPEGSTVTLLFKDMGDDKTDVKLTHLKFMNEETRDNHKMGWGSILTELDKLLEK